jgi:hypothetical protein
MPVSINSGDSNKMAEMLSKLKKQGYEEYTPSFQPDVGFCYNELESFNLKEQVNFFKALEKAGVAFPVQTLSTILKCNTCSSPYFCIKYVCTFCRMSNIVRGTAIEHDTCGNVDFDYKYKSNDGRLICDKCNRELKALGVDYSKISYFYKCQECNAMLPAIELHYGCLHCGKFLMQDEPQALQLFKYAIKPEKLSVLFDKTVYLSSIKDRLDKIGIRSMINDTVIGSSTVQHTFDLVTYDNQDQPLVVLHMLESSLNGNYDDETIILSFIGRCMDINISNKILIGFSKLRGRAKLLADTFALNTIEITDLGDDSHLTKVVDAIAELSSRITSRGSAV